MADVLHVPTITKNLVSIGQMVEQGLQVKFNSDGCFVEDPNNKFKMVAKDKRIGRMFTLNVKILAGSNMLYTQKNAVITDMDIWHKRIGHVNVQLLKTMQSQNVVAVCQIFRFQACRKFVKHVNLGNRLDMCFRTKSMYQGDPLN